MSSEEYKKLEKLWYDRLKKKGFNDIESRAKDRPLKDYHSFKFISASSQRRQMQRAPYQAQIENLRHREEYKEIVKSIAKRSDFSRSKVSLVWDMHCEGKTERDIATAFKVSKTCIHKILEKFRAWMSVL